jgi:hypothetical protein
MSELRYLSQHNFEKVALSLEASEVGKSRLSALVMWAQFPTQDDALAFLDLCRAGVFVDNVYPSLSRKGKAVIKFLR